MMHLPASVRAYLCLNPCDMRRDFEGLHALVRHHFKSAGHSRRGLPNSMGTRRNARCDHVFRCKTDRITVIPLLFLLISSILSGRSQQPASVTAGRVQPNRLPVR